MAKQDHQVSLVKTEASNERSAAHLVFRLTGNDSSRLPPTIYFLSSAASVRSNYSAQWFHVRETTHSHSSRVTFCKVFSLRVEKICVSNRDTLERRYCVELIYPPPSLISLSIVWWITCRCRCTFPVMQHRVHDAQACIRHVWSTADDACSAEFLRIYPRGPIPNGLLSELIFFVFEPAVTDDGSSCVK